MKTRKLKDNETECAMCGRPIDIDKAKWVELSNSDNNFYRDEIPEGHLSQGGFMVGPDCYKKALKIKK